MAMVGRIVGVDSLERMLSCQVTAAGDGQLEAVNVKTLFIGVSKQPYKVVFLNT